MTKSDLLCTTTITGDIICKCIYKRDSERELDVINGKSRQTVRGAFTIDVTSRNLYRIIKEIWKAIEKNIKKKKKLTTQQRKKGQLFSFSRQSRVVVANNFFLFFWSVPTQTTIYCGRDLTFSIIRNCTPKVFDDGNLFDMFGERTLAMDQWTRVVLDGTAAGRLFR